MTFFALRLCFSVRLYLALLIPEWRYDSFKLDRSKKEMVEKLSPVRINYLRNTFSVFFAFKKDGRLLTQTRLRVSFRPLPQTTPKRKLSKLKIDPNLDMSVR